MKSLMVACNSSYLVGLFDAYCRPISYINSGKTSITTC